jgi:hypothetical protein
MAAPGGQQKRTSPLAIQRVDCGPLGQQQAGNGGQVFVRGNVERGEALPVHFVHLYLKGQSHYIKEKFDFV